MVSVKYFGMVAEATKCPEELFDLKSSKLSILLNELNEKYSLSSFPITIAVNKTLVAISDDIMVYEHDEIAILPPYAGG